MKIIVKNLNFPKMILKTDAHENFRGFEPFEVFKVIFSELFDPLKTCAYYHVIITCLGHPSPKKL